MNEKQDYSIILDHIKAAGKSSCIHTCQEANFLAGHLTTLHGEYECAVKLAEEYISRLAVEHAEIVRVKKLLINSAKPFDELRQLVAKMSDLELSGEMQKTIHKILNLHAASTTPYDAACALLHGIDIEFTGKGEQPERVAA